MTTTNQSIQLTDIQANVLQLVSNAEMRSKSQMLSLLLAEGVRFYFCDREPFWGGVDLDVEEMISQLETDAIVSVLRDGVK